MKREAKINTTVESLKTQMASLKRQLADLEQAVENGFIAPAMAGEINHHSYSLTFLVGELWGLCRGQFNTETD